MDKQLLQTSINSFQSALFGSIETATYNGVKYADGQKAKEALIRSQTLILNIHEAVKRSFSNTLKNNSKYTWSVYPPIGESSPELKIFGKLKAKNQDLVYLRTQPQRSRITDGPCVGQIDPIGVEAIQRSIIIGIRSQMSSVDKNFDTLMERAFAETLNLRLRSPALTMGEVYILPIVEFDVKAMQTNQIKFLKSKVKLEKFVRIFESFTEREDLDIENQFKYDSSALIPIDFNTSPPAVIFDADDLSSYQYDDNLCKLFESISASGFDDRLLSSYKHFQETQGL